MLGSQNLGLGSVPLAGDKPDPGTGTGDVDSVTATVAAVVSQVDPANPVIQVSTVVGAAVGPALVGTGNALSREGHSHPPLVAANAAAMTAIVVTDIPDGARCYVTTRDRVFRLLTTAITVNTWDTIASAAAGRRWVAENTLSLKSAAQTTWSVDPANITGVASDDATGINDAAPLRSMSELGCRLRGAPLEVSPVFRLLSNMPATDLPYFDYTCVGGGAFPILRGVPTVLFSTTVSAVAQAAAAPAADDNTISAAALAVSWTASGALAKGVILRRSNGTQLWFHALAEPVAKTLRITQPINLGSTAATPYPIVNDTIQALTLPKVQALAFKDASQFQMYAELIEDVGSYSTAVLPVLYTNCYVSTARLEQDCANYINCLFNCPGYQRYAGPGLAIHVGGGFKGTGATQYTFLGSKVQYINRIFLQGCGWQWNSNAQVATAVGGSLHMYDSSVPAVTALYWSFALIAAISGTGNTGKLLNAGLWSQIAYITGAGAVAGSSTDANAYVVGGVASATGVDVPLTAQGNGVYKTA